MCVYRAGSQFLEIRRNCKNSSNYCGLPVDQGLWVVLAEVSQQLVNEPADQRPGSVNSSNKLRYNLEPIVNLDGADALM